MSSVSAISLEAIAPLAGFKNKVINGDFSVWQRNRNELSEFPNYPASGTSLLGPSAGYKYLADKWYAYSNVPSTAAEWTFTITKGALGLGDLGIINEPENYLKISTSINQIGGQPSNPTSGLAQCIENVRSVGPGNVSLSYWAKTTSATGDFNINLIQNFGTGGGQSSNVTYTTIGNVTTSWTYYEHNFVFANLAGKSKGGSSNGHLCLEFELEENGISTPLSDLWITNVQIENDNNATLFENRGVQQELLLCKRYFQNTVNTWSGWISPRVDNVTTAPDPDRPRHFGDGHQYYSQIDFQVPLRKKPIVFGVESYELKSGNNYDVFSSLPDAFDVKLDWMERGGPYGITAADWFAHGITHGYTGYSTATWSQAEWSAAWQRPGKNPWEHYEWAIVGRSPINNSNVGGEWSGGWIANYTFDSDYYEDESGK